MYVFGIDKNGCLGAVMSEQTAKKVVAAGRAKWVGYNVVQFPKIFCRPLALEKLLERGIPLPDTARPEVAWAENDTVYEVKDIADKTRGKYAYETISTCREILRREMERPDDRTVAEVATAGELCQVLRLDPSRGEKPKTVGYSSAQRKKQRLEEKPGPLTVIENAFPRIRIFHDKDIGLGLHGQARKSARRRAFQKLSELYAELRERFGLPRWGTKIDFNNEIYVKREYLLESIQGLIHRLLWGSPEFWKYWRKYYCQLEEIVMESQSPIRIKEDEESGSANSA